MKRASLVLSCGLALAALALWISLRARGHESVPAAPPPLAHDSALSSPAPALDTESRAPVAREQAESIAPAAASKTKGADRSCTISGYAWHLVEGKKQPLGDVELALWPGEAAQPISAESKALARTKSSASGAFRFSELTPGRYLAGIERAGAVRQLTEVELAGSEAWQTLEFVLGSARIEGRAFEQDGDAWPTLELEPITPHRSTLRRAPDAQKRFAFDDLPAGRYELRARWNASGPSRVRVDSSRIDLDDDQRLTYDAGGPATLPRWGGKVAFAVGGVPEPRARLSFEPYVPERADGVIYGNHGDSRTDPDLHSTQEDPYLYVFASLDAQGRFDVALPPRHWAVYLELDASTHQRRRLGDALLEGGTLARDLACPGSRIRGRVLLGEAPLAAKGLKVVATQCSEPRYGVFCTSPVDARGEFVFDGMEEGDWALVPEPRNKKEWEFKAPRVVLGAESKVVEQDLLLRKR